MDLPQVYEGLSPEQREAIEKAVFAGNKIEAIKLYRAAKGSDLASAKGAVEEIAAYLLERSPELFRKAPAGTGGNGGGKGGCLGMVALFLAGLSLVIWNWK